MKRLDNLETSCLRIGGSDQAKVELFSLIETQSHHY